MAKIVKKRRGSTAEHATFTGAVGELTVNTDLDTVVVHDGVTVGGFPMARADGLNLFPAGGTSGQVLSTDGSGNLSFISISDQVLSGDISGSIGNTQISADSVGINELNVVDGSNGQVLTTDGSGNLSFTPGATVTGASTAFAVAVAIALG